MSIHHSRTAAVKRGNPFFVPPDILQRPRPRILDGAAPLCDTLAVAGRKP